MQDIASENIISERAAQAGRWHLHNEFMYQLATGGILAALSVILLSLVPFFYFYRTTHADDIELRTIGCMGVAASVAFLIFGLTEGVFSPKQIVNFYVFVISVLMALLLQRKRSMEE
jgi:O-antigen ligase